ncbi:MAG: FkbM family methyltransferase [Azonexus sp.]
MHLRFLPQYVDGLRFDMLRTAYETEGMSFAIPKGSTKLPHRARFWRDTHEFDERELVKQYLPHDATVLELGACLGIVSCVIGRALDRPERHVAVEANPALISALEANRDRNTASFRVEHGLVSRRSDGSFFLSDCFVMSSGTADVGEKITVPVLTVEEIEARNQLKFDAVFMDIQGGELEFLEDNADFLTRCRCVILEVHPHIIGEEKCELCRTRLKSAGLELTAHRGLVEVWLRPRVRV